MKRIAVFLALALPLAALAAAGVVPDAEEAAVRDAVQHYFDGMMGANPELLQRAFHPEARLMGLNPENGEMWLIPFDRWAASWEGRDPRDVTRYRNAVVSVDITGTAASVKTDLEWPGVHYVDYLQLLKVNGEWKIVSKIWWQESR